MTYYWIIFLLSITCTHASTQLETGSFDDQVYGKDGVVLLYDMDSERIGNNGAFFEAQDHSGAHPDVVESLMAEAMAWHAETACPYGAAPGTCKVPSVPGCEASPFPGRH